MTRRKNKPRRRSARVARRRGVTVTQHITDKPIPARLASVSVEHTPALIEQLRRNTPHVDICEVTISGGTRRNVRAFSIILPTDEVGDEWFIRIEADADADADAQTIFLEFALATLMLTPAEHHPTLKTLAASGHLHQALELAQSLIGDP
jgi:hypothetical protein